MHDLLLFVRGISADTVHIGSNMIFRAQIDDLLSYIELFEEIRVGFAQRCL